MIKLKIFSGVYDFPKNLEKKINDFVDEMHAKVITIEKEDYDTYYVWYEEPEQKTDEEKVRGLNIFKKDEDFYREIAFHCYCNNVPVGRFYEGMRTDFGELWDEKKEELIKKIARQIDEQV